MARKIYFYSLIFSLLFFCGKIFANPIDNAINANQKFSSSIVSISVKDANTGNTLYEKNQNILVHPASTLKIITSSAALDYLGNNYEFSTAIYKNGNKIYFKVGADPLFTYADMYNLVSQYQSKNTGVIRNFIIDDSIIDEIPYGIGWQWDDNASYYFPQMSPYIINQNLFMLKATINDRKVVNIEKGKEYFEPIINNLKFGENNNVKIERNVFQANAPITLSGTINKNRMLYIPALNPSVMYKNMMMYSFLNANIPFNSKFKYEKVPNFSSTEAKITHSILEILEKINADSNNLAAETLLKHAAAIKYEKTGSTKDGLKIVKNFYMNNNVDTSNVFIVDASGVSMNDYVTTDFITDALNVIKKNQFYTDVLASMSTPSKGTFKGRLPELNNKIFVKTGSLANTSAVVGYIKTQNNKDLSFAIILDNIPANIDAKAFENEIIKAISQF